MSEREKEMMNSLMQHQALKITEVIVKKYYLLIAIVLSLFILPVIFTFFTQGWTLFHAFPLFLIGCFFLYYYTIHHTSKKKENKKIKEKKKEIGNKKIDVNEQVLFYEKRRVMLILFKGLSKFEHANTNIEEVRNNMWSEKVNKDHTFDWYYKNLNEIIDVVVYTREQLYFYLKRLSHNVNDFHHLTPLVQHEILKYTQYLDVQHNLESNGNTHNYYHKFHYNQKPLYDKTYEEISMLFKYVDDYAKMYIEEFN